MKPLHGRSGFFIVLCSSLTCLTFAHLVQAADSSAQKARPVVSLYDNLGDLHHTIITKDSRAQKYFDQGLRLTYGFNHAEAIRAYMEAARLDPQCAMCYWGVALDYGPNINLPMDADSGVKAYAAVQQALALLPHASAQEQDYIHAVAARYAAKPEADRAALDRPA